MRAKRMEGWVSGVCVVFVVTVTVYSAAPASAAGLTWNSAGGGVWNDSANWTPNEVPNTSDDTVTFTNIPPVVVSTNDIPGLSISAVRIRSGTNTLDMGSNALTSMVFAVQGWGPGSNAVLTVTNRGMIVVTDNLAVGATNGNIASLYAVAHMRLAPDVGLQVGLSTNSRALLQVSDNRGSQDRQYDASFVAGALFNAYLSDLFVGYRNGGYNALPTYGLLDLSAVTNEGVVDVAGSVIVGRDVNTKGDIIVSDSLDFRIGSAQARGGDLSVAGYNCSAGYNSALTLGAGRFDAYVTNLLIGFNLAVGAIHATNVSEGVLDVSKALRMCEGGNGDNGAYIYLSDGMDVKIGDTGARGSFNMGGGQQNQYAAFVMGAGRFEAYVTNFWMNVGGQNGRVRNFTFSATNVSDGVLDVSESLLVNASRNAAAGLVAVMLGNGFTTIVGHSSQRAIMQVGGPSSYTTRFAAAGSFTAYLTELTVASNTATATLDLSGVTNGTLDVSGLVSIGGAPAAVGEVRLPAIPAAADSLVVGSTNTGAKGTLVLTSTVFSVSGAVTLDGPTVANRARVLTTVAGIPGGLDLGDSSTLTVNQGLIDIVFEDPTEYSSVYWGLRWEGSHASDLTTLQGAGKLAWDDSAVVNTTVTGPVSIFEEGGFTYVGTKMEKPRGVLMTIM